MPMGMLGLADLIDREGYTVRLIHLGIEKQINNHYDAATLIEEEEPDILLLSLHWHFQSHSTIEFAKRIKNISKKVLVGIGGLTASFYAREIMENFSCIDFIIQGDAEVPVVELIKSLEHKQSLQKIPNLVYRSSKDIIHSNPITFVADEAILNNIHYHRLDLFKNHPYYSSKLCYSYNTIDKGLLQNNELYIPLGRGCNVNCIDCGGSKEAFKLTCNRKDITIRKVEAVARDILTLYDQYNITKINLCFDALLHSKNMDYFKNLFSLIRKHTQEIGCNFFAWFSLIDEDFIKHYKQTFNIEQSTLFISTTHLSERIRSQHGGIDFDYDQLKNIVQIITHNKISCVLCNYYHPYESKEDTINKVAVSSELAKKYGVSFIHEIPELEPASLWDLENEKGIEKSRSCFMDYYQYNKTFFMLRLGFPEDLGYQSDHWKSKVFYSRMSLDNQIESIREACTRALDDHYQSLYFHASIGPENLHRWIRAKNLWHYFFIYGIKNLQSLWGILDHLTSRYQYIIDIMLLDNIKHRYKYADPDISVPLKFFKISPVGPLAYKAESHPDFVLFYNSSIEDLMHHQDADELFIDSCRWGRDTCPAVTGSRIYINKKNIPKACLFGPPLSCDHYTAMNEQIQQILMETRKRRGCSSCPIIDSCPCCLFVTPFDEETYCSIMKEKYH